MVTEAPHSMTNVQTDANEIVTTFVQHGDPGRQQPYSQGRPVLALGVCAAHRRCRLEQGAAQRLFERGVVWGIMKNRENRKALPEFVDRNDDR